MGTQTQNRIDVIHGVNLDQLGRRNPEHYGRLTLTELEFQIREWARERRLAVVFFQTNHEGDFVERLHRLPDEADGVILNPGAWTHYSWAIHDALDLAGVPAVEVHISDVGKREAWRRKSVISDLVVASVSGEGIEGYRTALDVLADRFEGSPS